MDNEGMVQWYCGLGKPWKIEDNPMFAVSVAKGQIENIRKGLETFTGKKWEVSNGTHHSVPHTFNCGCCNTSWNEYEEYHVKNAGAGYRIIGQVTTVPIASLLRSETHCDDFRIAVLFSGNCKVCGDNLCGECIPPTRGRNAGRCKNCKKKSWEK
tara:strand:- start:22768 stop:23232 length:465 start_codon:yes stop_codon:yes gene_type:complete